MDGQITRMSLSGRIKLLDAIGEADHAIKRLKDAASMCGNLDLAAACGRSARRLSDELAIMQRMVDDKLRILTAVKKIWGARVTTVFPRQGHYAHDPKALAGYPAADISVDRIGDLLKFSLEKFASCENTRQTAP